MTGQGRQRPAAPAAALESGQDTEVSAVTHRLFDHLRQYAIGAVSEYEDHQFDAFVQELVYEARVWLRAAVAGPSPGPGAAASIEHEAMATVRRVARWVWQSTRPVPGRPE